MLFSFSVNAVTDPNNLTEGEDYKVLLQRLEQEALLRPNIQTQWLQAGTGEYLAIRKNNLNREDRGVVIFTHDVQQHPAWPGLLHSGMDVFPLYGWNVLSVSMPFLRTSNSSGDIENADNSEFRKQLFDCLSAAFVEARKLQPKQIVLVLQGSYVEHALSLFQQHQQQPDGLIFVTDLTRKSAEVVTDVSELNPAILEISFSNFSSQQEELVRLRKKTHQDKHHMYRQFVWPLTSRQSQQDLYFAEEIAGWLTSLSKGRLNRKFWHGQTW